ncbi:MAG: LamG domain-containing protein [Phycisphaeraceae bacterium]|nr:MAG: LamG domain-containing protein [Phycisphaeraceae bacterium]
MKLSLAEMKLALPAAALLAATAGAQTLSYLDFEDEADGSTITSITENGNFWFAFANTAGEYPVGSLLQPDPNSYPVGYPGSVLSGDFSPGFGYLEVEGDSFDLPATGWTIECRVRFENVGGFQTILGRDRDLLEDRTPLADLYFQKNSANHFSCSMVTSIVDNGDGTFTVNRPYTEGTTTTVAGVWYHVAAVYNPTAQTLNLYVDGQLEDSEAAPENIIAVTDPFSQFYSVGRGSYGGNAVDGLVAQIDDLRVTGAVLAPEDFLFVAPPPPCYADLNGDNALDALDQFAMVTAVDDGCPGAGPLTTALADDFSGAGGQLDGAAADIGGNWSASLDWLDNGEIAETQDGGAILALDAQPNYVYTLNCELTNTTSQWVAVGFCRDALSNPGQAVQYTDRFSNELEGIAWMLVRNDPARNDVEVFGGYRTAGGLFGQDVAGLDFNNPIQLQVIIDTRGDGSSFTAEFYLNGSLLVGPTTINIPVDDINFAGFSYDYGSGGTNPVINDFTATSVYYAPCTADRDGDGMTTMLDLIDYLAEYDAGCVFP